MPVSLKKPNNDTDVTTAPTRSRTSAEDRSAEIEERIHDTIEDAANKTLFSDTADNVFEMLYGYKDENGVVHKDFEIRDITGRDEEAVQKAEIKSNGAKVATTLLARCVTRIGTYEAAKLGQGKWFELIRSLFVGDQDYMLLTLRSFSIGSEISATHVCPNPDCKAKLKSIISVDELEVLPFIAGEVDFELPRGYRDRRGNVHKTGVIRLPKGIDREILMPLARTNLAKAETVMLTRTLTFDDGFPVDDDVTGGLTIKDREYLSNLQKEYYFGVKLDFDVTCDTCGETFTGTLNAANFI